MEEIEASRIAFLEQRDGKAATVEWCRRTMGIYRTCVLLSAKRGYGVKGSKLADKPPHHASFREYRRGFIESYLHFKQYVKGCRNRPTA